MKYLWLVIAACMLMSSGCSNSSNETVVVPVKRPGAEKAPGRGGRDGGRSMVSAGPSVGEEAPDIEGNDLDGKSFKLSDYRGKVVLLDFWGDW